MLDYNNIPESPNSVIFHYTGAVQVFAKPKGCSMLYILAVGGGSGGTNGATALGGRGGGGGNVFVTILPAVFVPDIVYVSVGAGGISGNTGNITTVYGKVTGGHYLAYASGGLSSGASRAADDTANYKAFGITGNHKNNAGTQPNAAEGDAAGGSLTFDDGASGGTAGGSFDPVWGDAYGPGEISLSGGAIINTGSCNPGKTVHKLYRTGGIGGTAGVAGMVNGGVGALGCGGGGGGAYISNSVGGNGGHGFVRFIWW